MQTGTKKVQIRRYSIALKRKVVEEVERGELTIREAIRMYDIVSARTVNRWVWQYGKKKYQTQVVRVTVKSEYEKIEELKAALADERLRSRLYAKQLEAYEKYAPELKKRLGTKQLKEFEENQQKIKQYR